MQTIGHHTCSQNNGSQYVLANSPFRANKNFSSKKTPFLGFGYYFWDDNFEMAMAWGMSHYNRHFFILEFALDLSGDAFLDLVGNRRCIRNFCELVQKIIESGYCKSNATMGEMIEILKRINIRQPGVFPYDIVRAVDTSIIPPLTDRLYFQEGKPNYTNLNPRIVICFQSKNDLLFKSKKIIFSS